MREARAAYFRENKLGEDGGYSSKWVRVQLGPVPFVFPNWPARIRAVKLHDLHHILTGYRTTNVGEFEISAWEIASGCKDYWAAWFLNLSGMGAGLYRCPRACLRAFVRGRRSDNLYGRDPEPLLDLTVAEARTAMRVPDASDRASRADIARFALWTAAGCLFGLAWFVPPALLVALVWWVVG